MFLGQKKKHSYASPLIDKYDILFRMIKYKNGRRIIYNSVQLYPHEEEIVQILVALGFVVELIPPDRPGGRKTADAIINNLEWEFKTPRGSSTRTIERILKKAYRQSENIIIDIRHLRLPEQIILHKIKYELKSRNKRIKRIKVITKSRKIIDL